MVSSNFKKVYNPDEILMGRAGSAGKRGLMHRPSSLSPDNVLRFLQVTPSGANLDGILRGLRLRKFERRPLGRILAKLKKKKAIEELPGGRVVLAGTRRRAEAEAGSRTEARRSAPDGQRSGASARNLLSGR